MSLFYLFVVFCLSMIPDNDTTNISSIHMLNDSNFKSGEVNHLIVFTAMNLYLVLKVDCLPLVTDENTFDEWIGKG